MSYMLRVASLVLVALTCGACASLCDVSTSRTIPAPLDPTCVVEALRVQPNVRRAEVSETGAIWAELIIPDGLENPTPQPTVSVAMRSDDGAAEISFSVDSVSCGANPEYRIHVENVLRALCDRTIERCGGGLTGGEVR
jgi:hypothetical protein